MCLILYSINSYFSYKINEKYYKNIHYVWCSPFFDSESLDSLHNSNPHSSNPRDIFNAYIKDVYSNDKHYKRTKIEENIIGIRNGAEDKLKNFVINEEQYEQIIGAIKIVQEEKDYNKFRPLIYIIPYDKVQKQITTSKISETADIFSSEIKITNLHKNLFDIIDINKEVIL
jgi:hypothetical protein